MTAAPPRLKTVLDAGQREALDLLQSGCNVFLTGAAGTGKSTVTTAFIGSSMRPVEVAATTGVAALNLRDQFRARCGVELNVSTVYRWAGINLGPMPGESHEDCFARLRRIASPAMMNGWRRVQRAECLVVDEVSMLPGRVLDYLDWHCRELRARPRDPFGGLQMVFVGDFLQLPPVSKGGAYDWAFQSRAWQNGCLVPAVLRTIHRQSDEAFTRLLNAVRTGKLGAAEMNVLAGRVATFPARELLRLFTHNVQVDKWNAFQLESIDSEEITEEMEVSDGPGVKFLLDNLLTPQTLRLKKGARVMVTVNLTAESGELVLVNGSLGTVEFWDNEFVFVKADAGGTHGIGRFTWKANPEREADGWVSQFPLRLAWASTIHKSQGLSLDAALIDARATRDPGQTYTALSRVRSLAGLHLRDVFTGVWVSNEAIKFMEAMK
jgi:ATP-dependent DNA helicase PIF1